jgi:protocatechuate 3,4-dioxygenase beta subunit
MAETVSRSRSARDRVRRRVLTTVLGFIDNRANIRRAAVLRPDQATAGQGNGPYYVPGSPVRRDVREGRDGVPLLLRIRVVGTGTLTPLAGASVEIWHCDSQGVYSGYQSYGADKFPALVSLTLRRFRPTDDAMFLRGLQRTDEAGYVEFQTIVPGWYTPRTLHIHAQVCIDGVAVLGTELYFPDDFATHVQSLAPYAARGLGPYRNNTDIEIRLAKGSPGSWLTLQPAGGGHRADITLQIPR